jgi:hypothetical protein
LVAILGAVCHASSRFDKDVLYLSEFRNISLERGSAVATISKRKISGAVSLGREPTDRARSRVDEGVNCYIENGLA